MVFGWCAPDGHQRTLYHLGTWLLLCLCVVPSAFSCLSPPILSPHYCLSGSTCVSLSLVCLPIYYPVVCSPVLIRCFRSCVCVCVCVMSACTAVLCLLVFPPSGGFCSYLFNFIIKRDHSSCNLSPRLISPHSL